MVTELRRMQQRRDTAANWASENPTLLAGEIGVEVNADGPELMKIGDGTTAWNALPYVQGEGGLPISDAHGGRPNPVVVNYEEEGSSGLEFTWGDLESGLPGKIQAVEDAFQFQVWDGESWRTLLSLDPYAVSTGPLSGSGGSVFGFGGPSAPPTTVSGGGTQALWAAALRDAPIGVRYEDRRAKSLRVRGARVYEKTSDVTVVPMTWKVIEGDTGARAISGGAGLPADHSIGYTNIQRVDGIVYAGLGGGVGFLDSDSSDSAPAGSWPAGFRPAWQTTVLLQNGGRFQLEPDGSWFIYSGDAEMDDAPLPAFSVPTADAWPAALPGVSFP